MNPTVSLVSNGDGTYDLLLEYSRGGAEFAKDFDVKKEIAKNSPTLLQTISSRAKQARIKSVKILVSGVLMATIAFSSFLTALGASDRYTMGYLYSGTDQQQIEYVNQTNNALDTVSPSYFDIQEDGSLKLNYLSQRLIDTMHQKGIKVVPFISNHWNRTAGINALKNADALSTQIANYVEKYNLDGVNVDIENVTHEQRDQYTEFVRLLREKIPSHKEVSVAVAANPNNWQVGWHGSYDYSALAEHADHLLIMAYDEHHEGGEAGPVASIDFVEKSIQYALRHTTADKIVMGVPFYGRVWSLDSNRIVGKGISSKTIQKILSDCESTVTFDQTSQSVKAEFTITETSGQYTVGGDFVLQPGKYVVWFENDQSYQAKLNLIQKYNLKGAGSWALGQEDPSIWDHYESWIDGDDHENTQPSEPSTPETPAPPENGGSTETPPAENIETSAWIVNSTKPVSVYKNANLKGKVLASLSGGTSVTVLGDQNSSTLRIRLSDGQIGYVSSNYITFKNPETPSTPSTPSPNYFLYEVQSGDTLWKIAQKYLGDGKRYPEIMEANGLKSTNIYPGMQLKIPGVSHESTPEISYREYTVKRGDSLWKIARTYLGSGDRYPEIMQLNGLTNEFIYPGQILKLPK